MHRPYFHQAMFGLFVLCVLFGTVLPAFIPLTNKLSAAGKDVSGGEYLFGLSLLLWACIIGLFYIFRQIELSKRVTVFIIAILAAVSVYVRYRYAVLCDQAYYSDFRVYWNIASKMVEEGLQPVTNVYIQRTLAFNYPLIYFFGNSDIVFKTANIILVTLSGLIASFMAGRWISNVAALGVFILISFVPETYYASLIPTHDISGSFYLIVCFLLTFLALEKAYQKRYRWAIAFAVLLSVFLILVQMQRGLYQVFIVTTGLSLIIWSAIKWKDIKVDKDALHKIIIPFLVVIFLPCLLYNVLYYSFEEILVLPKKPGGYADGRRVIRYNTLNTGTHASQIKQLENRFVHKLPGEYRKDFRRSLFLSDLYYDPMKRPANYFKRSERLYNLSSQLSFYLGRLKGLDKQEIRSTIETARVINRSFYASFLLFLLVSAIYTIFFQKSYNMISATALLFMSTASFALVTIGENQPRYLFMGYYLWPLVVTAMLSKCFEPSSVNKRVWHITNIRFGRYTSYGVACVVLIFAFAYIVFIVMFKYSSMRMLNMGDFEIVRCNDTIDKDTCAKGIIEFEETVTERKFAMLQMRLPGIPERNEFIRSERAISVDNDVKHHFSVFVQQPYKREDGRKGFFDIVISANDRKAVLHLEDTDAIVHVLLERITPVDGVIKVSFEIRCNRCGRRASWQRASLTKFMFGRLFPAGTESSQPVDTPLACNSVDERGGKCGGWRDFGEYSTGLLPPHYYRGPLQPAADASDCS